MTKEEFEYFDVVVSKYKEYADEINRLNDIRDFLSRDDVDLHIRLFGSMDVLTKPKITNIDLRELGPHIRTWIDGKIQELKEWQGDLAVNIFAVEQIGDTDG